MLLSKQSIQTYALDDLGFDDCRVSSPFLNKSVKQKYTEWLRKGHAGDMSYLERHWPLKENPNQLLPGVRSAIMLIKSYKNTHGRELPQKNKIARYAVGKDYHLVIAKKLKQLEAFVHEKHLGVKTFIGVDSRPIAERSLALKAGLGFLGKNTMVIKPGLGSYFFIGGMLTTLSLEEDTPLNVNCGTCRLCIDSCPTQALNEDYTMNATQCISYMTIEQKKALDLKGLEQTKDWLYGCDICQEACPYNHGHAPLTDWQDFHPEQGVGFDFFKEREDSDELGPISKKTPLYRSRKLVKQHWSILKNK